MWWNVKGDDWIQYFTGIFLGPAKRTETDDLMDEAIRLVRIYRNQCIIAAEKKKRKNK